MLEEIEQVSSVVKIRLGLADHYGADLGGLTDEKSMAEALQQRVEPQRVAGALDADGQGWGKRGIELFDSIAGVEELSVKQLGRVSVQDCHLLLTCVEIAADENHEFGLRYGDVVVLGLAEATSDAQPFS